MTLRIGQDLGEESGLERAENEGSQEKRDRNGEK